MTVFGTPEHVDERYTFCETNPEAKAVGLRLLGASVGATVGLLGFELGRLVGMVGAIVGGAVGPLMHSTETKISSEEKFK